MPAPQPWLGHPARSLSKSTTSSTLQTQPLTYSPLVPPNKRHLAECQRHNRGSGILPVASLSPPSSINSPTSNFIPEGKDPPGGPRRWAVLVIHQDPRFADRMIYPKRSPLFSGFLPTSSSRLGSPSFVPLLRHLRLDLLKIRRPLHPQCVQKTVVIGATQDSI